MSTSTNLVRMRKTTSKLQPLSDEPQIVSHLVNELAEGPLWSPLNQSLYWLDITNKKLFERNLSINEINHWELPHTVTSMVCDKFDADILWLISEKALLNFNVITGKCEEALSISIPQGYRTNDGSVGPDGKYWFGTMMYQPQSGRGDIFSIDKEMVLKLEFSGIAIPNTFCWPNDNCLILSDSLHQKSYFWDVTSKMEKRDTFLDLSSTLGTPDGGAVDEKGNIWIALWGLSKVVCYSLQGDNIQEIDLPVPHPSSCCFGGIENDILFITTAREGLTPEQIQKYPHSGKVFCIKLLVKGAIVNDFEMGLTC